MIIGIDGNEANVKNRVGVNTYAYEILKNLKKVNTTHKFIIYLKETPLSDMPPKSESWVYKILPNRKFWILTSLSPYLIKNKNNESNFPKVFFSPSHYTPFIVQIPKICSIMDLGYLNSKAQFNLVTFWQLKYWTAISINTSKRIIAISEATKKDIVRHYPSASSKIAVTHLAYDKDKFNQKKSHNNVRRRDLEKLKKDFIFNSPFLLYIGTLKPSKNIEGIIKAFSKYKNLSKSDLKLVVAGKKGWMFESIFNLVNSLKLEDEVIFTDYVTDKEKIALLSGARALISPSYWEGFGLHVLESMALGTPVIISKKGSLKEVGGDAAIYVNPNDTNDIAQAMGKIVEMDSTKYNKLSIASDQWARRFSWEKTAQETLSIIESTV